MKILLFGKNGMLGSDLEKEFIRKKYDYKAVSHSECDIQDENSLAKLFAETNPKIVINAAALTNVDQCEEDEKLAMEINGYSVGKIAKEAEKIKAKFIHFSTDYVFDGEKKEGYKEEDKPNPLSIYGKSKLLGENLAKENCSNLYIFRICWLFGEQRKNLIEQIMENALSDKESSLVCDQFGSPTFTSDIAENLLEIVQNYSHDIYHLHNQGFAKRNEIGEFIYNLLGKKPNIKISKLNDFKFKAPRPRYSILIDTKLNKLRPWEEAIKDYIQRKTGIKFQ